MSRDQKPNRRDFLGTVLKSTVAGSVAASGVRTALAQIAGPKGVLVGPKPVIQPSDLVYQGGWRGPNADMGGADSPTTLNPYTYGVIAVRYVGGTAVSNRRLLMVEFSGYTGAVADIVELAPPANANPYVATGVASDQSVDMKPAAQMLVSRRWAATDWINTAWMNSSIFQATTGYHVSSLYWDDATGLLWFALNAPYATGCNYPVWGAVQLLDTVKQTVKGVPYCAVGTKFGPWYYKSATYLNGGGGTQASHYRSVNQFIIPVPLGGRSYVGGNKFLVTAGHQGYCGDASDGPSIHAVGDLTTAMANPVPYIKAVTQYCGGLSPVSPAGLRRPSTDYFATEPDAPCCGAVVNGEGCWGGSSPGQSINGAVWVDTGAKHGLIFFGWEAFGGIGYWAWNPKGTVNGSGIALPAVELPYASCRDSIRRTWNYQTGRSDYHGPRCENYRLQVRIFNPAHFAEVFAGTRSPYADTYNGLPGVRLSASANMRTAITNGTTIPMTAHENLETGGDSPAIAVNPGGRDVDMNGAAWDPVAQQVVWVRTAAGPTLEPVFCFFSVQ